ncbi:MAG: hypothetical protein WDM77_14740 [Steroidobacteraceae bacterium]
MNLLAFALGALTITLGLNLWLAILACLVGTLAYAVIAIGSVAHRARRPTRSALCPRAAFGMRGNLPNAFFPVLGGVGRLRSDQYDLRR